MRLIKKSSTQVYKKIAVLAPSSTERGKAPKKSVPESSYGRSFIDRVCQVQIFISIRICQLNRAPARQFSSKGKNMDSNKLPGIDNSGLNPEAETLQKAS